MIDLAGQKFGRLTVLSLSSRTTKEKTYWNCICECGGKTESRSDALRAGLSQSCGCLQKEAAAKTGRASRKHEYWHTRIHTSWSHMIDRCGNPQNARYPYYGGRGITVCEKWKHFLGFLEDMGEMPEGKTLERIDNSKGYSKENCYWADYKQQNRNRSNTLFVRHGAKLIPLAEYAEVKNMHYKHAYAMVRRGVLKALRPNMVA